MTGADAGGVGNAPALWVVEHIVTARTGTSMLLELLYFDGCPNWQNADRRLREVLALSGRQAEFRYRKVETHEEAERLGFRGSPTIRIDGHDPFAEEDAPVGLSCRIYRTEEGIEGAPSKAQLQIALERHG